MYVQQIHKKAFNRLLALLILHFFRTSIHWSLKISRLFVVTAFFYSDLFLVVVFLFYFLKTFPCYELPYFCFFMAPISRIKKSCLFCFCNIQKKSKQWRIQHFFNPVLKLRGLNYQDIKMGVTFLKNSSLLHIFHVFICVGNAHTSCSFYSSIICCHTVATHPPLCKLHRVWRRCSPPTFSFPFKSCSQWAFFKKAGGEVVGINKVNMAAVVVTRKHAFHDVDGCVVKGLRES